ncbi:MAG: gamma carbonic anhydrase family protein [Pseudomonadota bacterium]
MLQNNIRKYKNITPKIAENCYIDEFARVIGDVHIGNLSSVWPGCVIRGDVNHIRIGKKTNIQDGTIIHVWRHEGPTIIGDNVTIGHQALLHACILEDNCFIGMGAIVMDKALVETGAMVAAGAVVTPNKIVKKDEIWAGNPAKFMRKLTQQESDFIAISADNYVKLASEYTE